MFSQVRLMRFGSLWAPAGALLILAAVPASAAPPSAPPDPPTDTETPAPPPEASAPADAETPATPEVAPDPPTDTDAPAAPPQATAPVSTPAVQQSTETLSTSPVVTAPFAVEPPTAATPPEPGNGAPDEHPCCWTDSLSLSASIDSYYAVNYRFPALQNPGSTARAFDAYNGFNLAAAGIDASYDPDPVGGVLQLRFSPYAGATYAGADNSTELRFVKQAFGQWRPGGKDGSITLDFGKFETLYGAEVFDSWQNATYTRGVLYWLGQPLFHVGARATWQITPELDTKLMVVNGWNQNTDLNVGKSLGFQVNYASGTDFAMSLGWYGGPEQEDSYVLTEADGSETRYRLGSSNRRFRHLIDAVVKVAPTKSFSVLFNADYGTESAVTDPTTVETKRMTWYGAMLTARLAMNDTYAVALRGEYYADPQGYTFAGFVPSPQADGSYPEYTFETATLTFEALPTPNLILRLDNRIDVANESLFASKLGDTAKTQFTTTLGVAFTTN
jgi:Putative beta-barrel porin-2, OmpL-like. bbp2